MANIKVQGGVYITAATGYSWGRFHSSAGPTVYIFNNWQTVYRFEISKFWGQYTGQMEGIIDQQDKFW